VTACDACDGTGRVLAYRGRPLSVAFEKGRAKLDAYRTTSRIALLADLEALTDDVDLTLGAVAVVRLLHRPADWTAMSCPWCPAQVRQTKPPRDADEEWLREPRWKREARP
jgi:hypothetical protein